MPDRLKYLITPALAALVYDVLVEECEASEEERTAFLRLWPDCVEYRFVGNLGFGGKVWCANDKLYVTAYPEDTGFGATERAAVIRKANARLEVIRDTILANVGAGG